MSTLDPFSIHKKLKEGHDYAVEITYHKYTKLNGNYSAFGIGRYKGGEYVGPNHYYLWDVTIYAIQILNLINKMIVI